MTLPQCEVAFSLKHILFATDFNSCDETALHYLNQLVDGRHSQVQAVHVSGPDAYQLLDPEAFAVTFRQSGRFLGHASETLQTLLHGLPNEAPLRQGDVWDVLGDVAQRNQINLLVLASHGRTGFSKMLFGSVAEEIFHHLPCPVLTVGPHVPLNKGRAGIRNILLATDLAPNSLAPAYAQWLSNQFSASLSVMHATEKPSGSRNLEGIIRRIESILDDSIEMSHTSRIFVEHGPAAERILSVAEKQQYDLIVLGARHPRYLRALAHNPWATASRVVANARCPVVTILGT